MGASSRGGMANVLSDEKKQQVWHLGDWVGREDRGIKGPLSHARCADKGDSVNSRKARWSPTSPAWAAKLRARDGLHARCHSVAHGVVSVSERSDALKGLLRTFRLISSSTQEGRSLVWTTRVATQ